MLTLGLPLLLAAAAGCTGSTYEYGGYDMPDHFPLDGDTRSWEYANDGASYTLKVDMTAELVDLGDNLIVRTFEYWDDDTGTLLGTAQWSSDTINGILLHGYEIINEPGTGGGGDDTGDGGDDTADTGGMKAPAESVTFDPPLELADRQMTPGEVIETDTNGGSYTSTFNYAEDCPNNWVSGDATWQCLKITVEGPEMAFNGEYWIAPRYGISWMQRSGDADKWVLNKARFEGE